MSARRASVVADKTAGSVIGRYRLRGALVCATALLRELSAAHAVAFEVSVVVDPRIEHDLLRLAQRILY
eukprot:7284000-Lingulodinium_polyedra.AAC.1